MTTTRKTLLDRVKDRDDNEAWTEFYGLYAPLLFRYARARGLREGDADEVRDECLEVIARKMGDFEYDRSRGRFKGWLYRIASGKVVDLLRKRQEVRADTGDLMSVPDPAPTPDEVWQREWKEEHLRQSLERARRRVPTRDFEVFRMLLEEECPVPEVCDRLGINANQVYKAKGRVLRRVREALDTIDPGFPPVDP